MTTSICPYPRFKAFTASGIPLVGGKLYTYKPGTTTPTTTYTDSTGATPNANPVVLDSNGEADVWLAGFVKLVLQDSVGNQIWAKDNISMQYFGAATSSPWVLANLANLTYSNATQFTCSGNQVAILPQGIGIQVQVSAGLITGTISNSTANATVTTVTSTWGANQALDAGINQVFTALTPNTVPAAFIVPQWDANKALNAANWSSANSPYVQESTLREIRGVITGNANGIAIVDGAGFTANRTSGGVYGVAFSPAFGSGIPSVTLTCTADSIAANSLNGVFLIGAPSVNTFTLIVYKNNVAHDDTVCFVAQGLK